MQLQLYQETQIKSLKKIRKNLSAMIPHILEVVGAYMVASVILNFEEQGKGRPKKWVDNAPSTKARKKGNLILHESALLKLGIMYEVDEVENKVHVGPSGPALPYSAIHQFGGEAGRNRSVSIPARQYLAIQKIDHTWINKFVRNEVFYAPA